MKSAYPVILTPSGEDVVVYVPDFDINTEGSSLADAIEMARDAIGLVGIDLEDDGKPVPDASDVRTVSCSPDQLVALVDIDFAEYRRRNDLRTVRKNCTLPSWLCYAAEKADLNFSAVLQEGLKAHLGLN